MASHLQVDNALSTTAQSVKDQNGTISSLTLSTDAVGIGGNGRLGHIGIDDANGEHTITLGGPQGAGRISLGGKTSRGQVAIFDENTNFTINLGGIEGAARIGLGGNGSIGTIDVFDANTNHTIRMQGVGRIGLGGNGSIGTIDVFDANTNHTIRIGSAQGAGRIGLGGNGSGGVIDVFDANTNQTIKIDGETGDLEVTGDIRLLNADCAEDFTIGTSVSVEPGTIMVLGENGALIPSEHAYDKRVAGVVSGAGEYKPGIVLDKQHSASNRQPIALLGKAFCKVDARAGAIEVGDLLTTSATSGHAMKAADPLKAFGAVIGKALRPLAEGQGLIPILIALQ